MFRAPPTPEGPPRRARRALRSLRRARQDGLADPEPLPPEAETEQKDARSQGAGAWLRHNGQCSVREDRHEDGRRGCVREEARSVRGGEGAPRIGAGKDATGGVTYSHRPPPGERRRDRGPRTPRWYWQDPELTRTRRPSSGTRPHLLASQTRASSANPLQTRRPQVPKLGQAKPRPPEGRVRLKHAIHHALPSRGLLSDAGLGTSKVEGDPAMPHGEGGVLHDDVVVRSTANRDRGPGEFHGAPGERTAFMNESSHNRMRLGGLQFHESERTVSSHRQRGLQRSTRRESLRSIK